ncbi:dihydrolipoyl dehydrogenase [Pelagibacterales bacterium]|jgi:dihydrolipoamide dehydrogenase|nr:dihydrolipoyl dehydrogenase [Pelagibacterales bacterium]
MEEFDLIVIGSGPGGYVCAIRAAQLGLKVCCVEKRKTLGGTCLNIGCIPSKSLLHASQIYSDTKSYADIGINIDNVKLDLSKMMSSKDESVKGLTDGIQFLFKKNKITHIQGFGKITGKNEVTILNDEANQIINGKNIVIATGSEVSVPDDVIIDEKDILSSTGALSLDKVPDKLVVIGAGYIGLEMGSVWSRLGSKVTVIEYADRIVPNMDNEISDQFQKILIKQGIDFKLSTAFKKINKKNDKLYVAIETQQGQASEISCDKVLISIGRKPYTFGLNLEKVGVKTDEKGFIITKNNFQTSVENIFAIGDCKLGPMLAHKASEEGTALAEIIVGQAGHVNFDTIPSVVYTSPEVASVGKTEEELKSANISYKVGKFPFTANAKAKIMHQTGGFVKILSDATSDKVLGVHMIGADVGNMIAELALAMEFGASSEDIARTCHAHPTLTESIKEAALNVEKRAIHI